MEGVRDGGGTTCHGIEGWGHLQADVVFKMKRDHDCTLAGVLIRIDNKYIFLIIIVIKIFAY